MTTSAPSFDAPRSARLGGPGDLLAALPGLLGFPPERSLVVLCLDRDDTICGMARVDLEPGEPDEIARPIATFCARRPTAAVFAAIVDDGDRSLHDNVLRALHLALAAAGLCLPVAYHVRSMRPGAAWRTLLGPPASGVLPDPMAGPIAMAAVLDGRPLHASRAEFAAQLARDEPRCAEVAAILAGRPAWPERTGKGRLEHVLWQVANVASGAELSAGEFARLASALRDRVARDALSGLAFGDQAAVAELLWTELVRVLPDPHRAAPATLLGHSAYARGAGPLAGIAFEVALTADPGYQLARLLDTALGAGLPPQVAREVAETGHECAARLGVTLPRAGAR